MKNKAKVLSIVLFLSAFLMVVLFGGQKAEWKGKIEVENGVKVIKNPRDPLYGEIEFELEEDLSIGREGDENYMFTLVVDIGVDMEGNIYVLDFRECRIKKYDKNGNYLQTIGRKGQGPGEFEQPSRILLNTEGKMYIKELRKIHIFDKKGEFERSIILKKTLASFGITKEGNILGRSYSSSRKGRTLDIVLIDSEGKKLKTIASFPDPRAFVKKGNIRIPGSTRYDPKLYFYPLSEKFGVYGYSSEYRLFIINSSGEISHIIEKEEPRQTVTQKEKDKIIKEHMKRRRRLPLKLSEGDIRKLSNFPKYKAFYTRLLTDDKGRIYVLKMKSKLNEDKDDIFDLFSQEGFYLYSVKIHDVFPQIVKNGFLYTLKNDPDSGLHKIIRYRIKNWERIKEGI